jgi:hypothetical protein
MIGIVITRRLDTVAALIKLFDRDGPILQSRPDAEWRNGRMVEGSMFLFALCVLREGRSKILGPFALTWPQSSQI